jgi:hypothetical protein
MYGKYGVGSYDHHCTNQCFIQITKLEKFFRVAPEEPDKHLFHVTNATNIITPNNWQ